MSCWFFQQDDVPVESLRSEDSTSPLVGRATCSRCLNTPGWSRKKVEIKERSSFKDSHQRRDGQQQVSASEDQQREHKHTHLAIVVEVGVKADAVSPRGLQVDQRWWIRIVLRKINIKLKTAVGIRSVSWTCYKNLQTREISWDGSTHTHTHRQ